MPSRVISLADLNAEILAARRAYPDVKFTKDGVHARLAGDIVMARTVLRALDYDAAKLAALETRWRELPDLNLGEKNFKEPGVQPHPAKLTTSKTTGVLIDAFTKVAANGFADEIRAEFALWFGLTPMVDVCSGIVAPDKTEAYSVVAKDSRVRIAAADAAGASYAVRTLFQLSVPRRGTRTTTGALIPECEIEDGPALAWRGTHLCWFPENDEFELTRALYLSALFKFNYVVIENWGAFRSERHPWYGWPNGQMTPSAAWRPWRRGLA